VIPSERKSLFLDAPVSDSTCDLHIVAVEAYADWLQAQPAAICQWLSSSGFTGKAGQSALCPNTDGHLAAVVYMIPECEATGPRAWSGLVAGLPAGDYQVVSSLSSQRLEWLCCGWILGQYRFDRYKSMPEADCKRLVWPMGVDCEHVARQVDATCLVRDLVNTPADDMSPQHLALVAQLMAENFEAACDVIIGEDLIDEGYPGVYAVGRASDIEPQLIDMRWGDQNAPKLTIVGKGVCFDSGGLDIKPSGGMKIMKKDMGGAAHALALAHMIMDAQLPVCLRVLVPAVENSISGNALHPMDIVTTRSGKTVEIGNTDAEGRVILADALTAAGEDDPELIIDFATLTGAARSALGPDVPAAYTGSDKMALELMQMSVACGDPLWRMPLWSPYARMIEGKTADLTNAAETPFAGSITAALFLAAFVPDSEKWLHFDLYAWNPSGRSGQPEGGEAQTLRAVYGMLAERFSA